jgi:hypothetical protein
MVQPLSQTTSIKTANNIVRKMVNSGLITANIIGTRETCWKLHGMSPNVKKNGESRALQADQEPQSSSNAFPFIKERLDQMYKLLESQTPSCSMAQKCNFPKSAHLSVISNRTWIVDSGDTDRMTRESSLFSSYNHAQEIPKLALFQPWQQKVLLFSQIWDM